MEIPIMNIDFDTISFDINGVSYSYNSPETAKQALDSLALELRKAVHDKNIQLAYEIEDKMCNIEYNIDYMCMEYTRKLLVDII